jgi:hypothetical protein
MHTLAYKACIVSAYQANSSRLVERDYIDYMYTFHILQNV